MLADDDVRSELLHRLDEVTVTSRGGLESFDSLDARHATDVIAENIVRAAEGVDDYDSGLEAIVRRFTRPVLLIQQSTFTPGVDGFRGSEVINRWLTTAKNRIEVAAPSVGRIELRNHRLDWAGSGWMVAPDIAITNRHVADYFARETGSGFAFRESPGHRIVHASFDWRREHDRPEESLARVDEVIWMEPDSAYDVALLRVSALDEPALPEPIALMTRSEIDAALDSWVAVIGYPERSMVNNADDQQRIFDGIYGVKRLAPGTVMSIAPDGLFYHDATTLGGNSGSVVVHLDSGKAIGLHFGGYEGDRNMAIQATVIADLLVQHG